MAYGKKLEDIIGYENVYISADVSKRRVDEYTDWPPETNTTYAHTLNFQGLGTNYSVRDLKLYGFDSTCATCPRHYSVMFVSGSSTTYEIDNTNEYYKNVLVYVGVDVNINNGSDFVKYLFDAISSVPDFLDHYTHYGYDYDTSEFFVFDNRSHEMIPDFYIQHMDFHTAAYVKIDHIEAVYVGPTIFVGQPYDKNDIIVTVYINTGDSFVLKIDEFTVDKTIITQVGENTVTVTYNDEGDIYTDTVIILGKRKPELHAEYTGPVIDLDFEYDPNDVIVWRVWFDIDENGNETTENEYLTPEQYTLSTLIVSEEFTPVKVYDPEYDMSCTIIVPGYTPLVVIWYEGPPVIVSLEPNHEDFRARTYGLRYIYEVPNDQIVVTHDEAPYCWRKYKDWFHASIPYNIYHKNPAWDNSYCWVMTLDNLISLQAQMLTDRLIISKELKAELKPENVWVLLNSNINGQETIDLSVCNVSQSWFTNIGKFEIEIKYRWYYHKDLYEEVSCFLTVIVESDYYKIMAWYEEFPVKAVGTYDPQWVVIYAFPYIGDWVRIDWADPHVTIDSYLVEKPDDPYDNMPWLEDGQPKWTEETWYKATYTTDFGEELSDIYPVIGYRERKYVEKKFEVLYYNTYSNKPNNTEKWEDYTATFQHVLSLGGTLVFDWYQFEIAVKRLEKYGLYKVTAPPEIGLDSRFWSEWKVIAEPNTNLCATMTHLYDEEDISNE